MKFTVSSSLLSKQVQKVIGIVGTSNILPILESLKLELSGNELKITANDLETFMTCKLEVLGEGDGAICISAKVLADYLKAIPEQPIKFDIGQDFSIKITTLKGKQSLVGEDVVNFPTDKEVEGEKITVDISTDDLFNGLSKCLKTIAADDMRPAMSGINMELADGILKFVSTDAHRLSIVSAKVEGKDFSFIVPAKPVPYIIKNIVPGTATLSIGQGRIEIEMENIRMGIVLVDSKFPDYKVVVPKDNPYQLTVNKNELINALKIVTIFSNKTTMQVVFDITKDQVILTAQDVDYSFSGEETIGCEFKGEDMKIAFNGKYLSEMAQTIETESVVFDLSSPSRAGLIKNDDPENTFLGLLMPLMLGV